MPEKFPPHLAWAEREKHFHSYYQNEIDAGSTCLDHILKSHLIGKIFEKDGFTAEITWVYSGFVPDENNEIEHGFVLFFEQYDSHIFVGDNEFFTLKEKMNPIY